MGERELGSAEGAGMPFRGPAEVEAEVEAEVDADEEADEEAADELAPSREAWQPPMAAEKAGGARITHQAARSRRKNRRNPGEGRGFGRKMWVTLARTSLSRLNILRKGARDCHTCWLFRFHLGAPAKDRATTDRRTPESEQAVE